MTIRAISLHNTGQRFLQLHKHFPVTGIKAVTFTALAPDIEELIAGETESGRFAQLVKSYRKGRYQQRLRETQKSTGVTRYELQQKIEQEFVQEVDL